MKRGRPRLDDKFALRSTITLSLPTSMHDALIHRARVLDLAVSVVVRNLIAPHFVTPKIDSPDSSAQ